MKLYSVWYYNKDKFKQEKGMRFGHLLEKLVEYGDQERKAKKFLGRLGRKQGGGPAYGSRSKHPASAVS